MAIGTRIKSALNSALRLTNLRLDTLTLAKNEHARLQRMSTLGCFDRPEFPLEQRLDTKFAQRILADITRYAPALRRLKEPTQNDVGFSLDNQYFGSPDAEVLYRMIREEKPERVIEVGSGHSTRIMRQAIMDGGLSTRLISIDPNPRTEVNSFIDECYRLPVEQLTTFKPFDALQTGDFLFIDSTHVVFPCNDVVFLYLKVLPRIPSGVFIHIHDIFFPYEYPLKIIQKGWGWNEEYLVAAMLLFSSSFESIWPGYFLQRTDPGFASSFPHIQLGTATSLWLRKMI